MSQFQLPARRDLFYGGGWHQAAGGSAAAVSPSTGQALGSFAGAGAEDVDRAVAAARAGFAEWRRVAPLERARLLREMARRLAARRDELAWIDAVDGGSPVRELRNDVDTAVAQLDFFASLVTEMKGASAPMGFFVQAEDGIRDKLVTGVQTCALPISLGSSSDAPVTRPGPSSLK